MDPFINVFDRTTLHAFSTVTDRHTCLQVTIFLLLNELSLDAISNAHSHLNTMTERTMKVVYFYDHPVCVCVCVCVSCRSRSVVPSKYWRSERSTLMDFETVWGKAPADAV
jgi:hypothetical protein